MYYNMLSRVRARRAHYIRPSCPKLLLDLIKDPHTFTVSK